MHQTYSYWTNGLHGRPISLDLTVPEGENKFPIVVLAHGFKGFKDWGHFPMLPAYFSAEGFACCRFNFSHNGVTELHGTEITDLDAFATNNFSIELDDLGVVIDFLEEKSVLHQLDMNCLYLIGHSRGGGLVVLKATEDRRIRKVVSWAGVPYLNRFWAPDLVAAWAKQGVQYVKNTRTGQLLPMRYSFYEDYRLHRDRFDLDGRLSLLQVPVLQVHGTLDEAVPLEWALEWKQKWPALELRVLEGENHVFGSSHPWQRPDLPNGVQKLMEQTCSFLKLE